LRFVEALRIRDRSITEDPFVVRRNDIIYRSIPTVSSPRVTFPLFGNGFKSWFAPLQAVQDDVGPLTIAPEIRLIPERTGESDPAEHKGISPPALSRCGQPLGT
jgi:hypothetical protein